MALYPTRTFTGNKLSPFMYPETAKEMPVALAPSQSLDAGTILSELTADPGVYAAYDNVGTDGTETAKGILKYDVQVDADGNIAFSASSDMTAGEHGEVSQVTPMFIQGCFSCADLTGLDAGAVADLGRLIQGDTTSGILLVQ